MADVTVRTVDVELRTAKLSKSILKQMPVLLMESVRPLLKANGDEDPDKVVGWVHGSVLGDDYKKWLIFKIGERLYGRYDAMDGTCRKYKQIYIV